MSSVDSSHQVPSLHLSSGGSIPVLGLGTFGSDKYSAKQVAHAVIDAATLGYRHFDCASVYGNEKEIGQSLAKILETIPRKDLFITSKLWNDKHAEDDVIPQCQQTLRDLQLDYLDMYLIHWPFPNHHGQGVDVNSRDPHAKPYIHENYMRTWRQMERLVEMGLVKNIGTSNVTRNKLELILKDCQIKPAVNQFEMHPHFQQTDLFNYLKENNIVPVGFSPIGSPSRPERDRTSENTVDIEDPIIVKIAQRLGIHPAEVCILWAVKRGAVTIPFSVKREQYERTLTAVTNPDKSLTDDDMQQIAKIDKNCRLIKGQVFLWEDAKDWRDLWDED